MALRCGVTLAWSGHLAASNAIPQSNSDQTEGVSSQNFGWPWLLEAPLLFLTF
jgi:hypothetical protein